MSLKQMLINRFTVISRKEDMKTHLMPYFNRGWKHRSGFLYADDNYIVVPLVRDSLLFESN